MVTRARIRSRTPNVTGAGGGGPTPGGTVQWGPDFGGTNGDRCKAQVAVDTSQLGLRGDLAGQAVVDTEQLGLRGDLAGQAAVDTTQMGLFADLAAQANIDTTLVIDARPPDEDTYLAENDPNTAKGAGTTLLAKTNAAVGNNELITYIAWDFTWMEAGSTVNSAIITIERSTSAIGSENGSFDVYSSSSKPFEEDTATWNGDEPITGGTLEESISHTFPTSTSTGTVTLGSATRSAMPGNWIWLRLEGASALGVSTLTITSKEGAVAPTMEVDWTLP